MIHRYNSLLPTQHDEWRRFEARGTRPRKMQAPMAVWINRPSRRGFTLVQSLIAVVVLCGIGGAVWAVNVAL